MLHLFCVLDSPSSPVVLKVEYHIVLSTIRNTDRICVMEHGQIVEQSTHYELLLEGVHYQQLYEIYFHDQQNGAVSEESRGRLVS